MSMKCERRRLQDDREFAQFVQLARNERVASYLEIGCKHGGTVWGMAKILPDGARIVAVDLPHGDGSFKKSGPNLIECIDALKKRGFDAHLFLDDSTNPDVIAKVTALAPFDLCFIDGNHTEPFVRSDWLHYGKLARLVAFHDISYDGRPVKEGKTCHVPQVWNELKQGRRHDEIKFTQGGYGIGVLWRT